jgi:hypothetical protein
LQIIPTLSVVVRVKSDCHFKKGVHMFTPRFLKIVRMMFDRGLKQPIATELSVPDNTAGFNNSHQDFMDRVQQDFAKRGYAIVDRENTSNGELLLFIRNEALHLVYCLPDETYVTTIEIQACWEAQCRLGAYSSAVVAPHEFSHAARHKAQSLAIELLPVESD